MKTPLPLAFAVPLLAAIGLGAAGCSRNESAPPPAAAAPAAGLPRPAAGEFSVMTFNLNQYALADRDGQADTLEPKPPEETRAIVEAIGQAAPDILAVQEMGDPAAWAEFKLALRQAGLDYGHEKYLRIGKGDLNTAVLSRFPIVADRSHVDDTYTIGPEQFSVLRGIIDVEIDVAPAYRLRLMVAHLKSKVFHAFGQAEMRRNEARLLGNHVRAALAENPAVNLLVVGDFNDDPSSAPLREIHTYKDKRLLHDLRPADAAGDAWTRRENDDRCSRSDYMLAGDGLLPEAILAKTGVARSLPLARASDHRPLVATFVAAERGPEAAPDLTRGLLPDIPQND